MSAPTGSPGARELIEAAKIGAVSAIRRALDAGVPVDERDEDGKTALHHAARQLRVKAVEALLAAGAPVDAEDRWQCTPLWEAVRGPEEASLTSDRRPLEISTIRTLVAAGADPLHACWDPRFEARFLPKSPWSWGGNGSDWRKNAAFGLSEDPEFCDSEHPFILRSNLAGQRSLMLESSRLDACISFALKHGVEHVRAVEAFPPEQRAQLLRLKDAPALKGVFIRPGEKVDARWIEELAQLESLEAPDPLAPLDLRYLSRLKALWIAWTPKLEWPGEGVPLESLSLPHCNPKPSDLTWLKRWASLRTFWAGVGSLKSLTGLDRLENVEEVRLLRLRGLVDVAALRSCPKLRMLLIHDSAKAVQLDVIRELKSLEELVLVGRFTIPSIRFIEELPKLRNFRFLHVNVEDGDLAPLARLDVAAFLPEKRHYSHTSEQIDQLIEQRRAPQKP